MCEAQIVAADVAMRATGTPALRLMERILGKEPKFVFFDNNKAMEEPYYEASGTKSRCCCHMDA